MQGTVDPMELFVLPAGHPARSYTPYVIWAAYWAAQALFWAAFVLLALLG